MNFRFRSAARAVTLFYDRILAPSGVRSTQFSILIVLQGFGPQSVQDLAHWLEMDRTTLSKNLKPLMARNLVEQHAGSDRRKRMLGLTEEGKNTLDRALPLWKQAQQTVEENLGEAAQTMRQRLKKISRIRPIDE
ncbi:MAG: winged helix-turn-helix transcriptional regulator [Leptospiraceae bacterium]|nr:winged helix-turn-helix transcriptional regulator [Leptospiraceae bacterium]MCB1304300.1 winged helix-turn-helix transcriptional regulator [Leptospiraceae bacterium]